MIPDVAQPFLVALNSTAKSTVCNQNFHLTSSYFNLISVYMKPEITAVIKWMAHSCVVKGSEKIMPSHLMFRIVKIVWAYLWILETCGMAHSVVIWKASQCRGFGGNKRVKLLCVCIYSMYGPKEVKLHAAFNPVWEKCVRLSFIHSGFFSDYELCLCFQGNKRLYTRSAWDKERGVTHFLMSVL